MLRPLRPRLILFLDFLAPNLIIRRSAGSNHSKVPRLPPRNGPSGTHDTVDVFDKIKKQIVHIHSPSFSDQSSLNDVGTKTFALLLQKLQEDDLHAACQHWTYLESNSLLRFLGHAHLKTYSNLVAQSCVNHPYEAVWDDEEVRVIEGIALLAASQGIYSALNAVMLAHIKKNRSHMAIDLYRKHMELQKGEPGWVDDTANDGVGEDNLEDDADSTLDYTLELALREDQPERATLLLIITTAYAVHDSFTGALQTWLNTRIPHRYLNLNTFLKNFPDNSKLRGKIQDYVHRLITARVIARPGSLSRQITQLAHSNAVDKLERFYQDIIAASSGSDAYITGDMSKSSDKHLLNIPEIGWTSFLSAFVKCRRFDLAERLWDDATRLGQHTGVSMWTALMDAYDTIGDTTKAVDTWETMLKSGIQPEGLTYRAVISALLNAQRVDEAMVIFRKFQNTILAQCPTETSLHVYNTVLHGLLVNVATDSARSLLQAMLKDGPAPDVVSFNSFMRYYGRRGDFKALASVLSDMTAAGVKGDVFTFSTVLSALLKIGRQDAPEMMLSLMRKQGITPNVATYTTIIDQQMREGTREGLQAALHLLQKMELDPNAQPNAVTYTSILSGMYRERHLASEELEAMRLDIEGRMRKRDIIPSRVTYQILIKACLLHPDPEGVQNALRYYREMVQRKIAFVQDTWYIILQGLFLRQEWGVADEMVADMLQSGFAPAPRVMNVVSKIRRRKVKVERTKYSANY